MGTIAMLSQDQRESALPGSTVYLLSYPQSQTLLSCSSASHAINTGLWPKCLNTSGLLSLWLTTAINISHIGTLSANTLKEPEFQLLPEKWEKDTSCSNFKQEHCVFGLINRSLFQVFVPAAKTQVAARLLSPQHCRTEKLTNESFNDPGSVAEI